ncbi:putative 2-heptaprenyl naphthoquinone protein [Botrytis fragariae]|uniref:Putative 2-heptaprenyl naphthoquinone protein n=1 Tax=Botrytis fragariae TaxID=1964551 RepID=A0A8H6EIG9_9HELO|nr:putative 2-heptaprenyl naphthoquinone protein [Botrytis fragariae]KAF5873464.1 putative 2-heptaprenyl naphthoquinone protein [Botrytis fragariae]
MSSTNVTSDDVAPKFYDSISDRYDKFYSQDQGLLAFIEQSLELLPPNASVLDVGSGTGIPTSLAVVNSGRKLHGIDIAPSMIQLSRKNVPGGTFELVSMLDYEPKDGHKFDAAFVVLSMFHMKRDEMIEAIGKWKDWVKGMEKDIFSSARMSRRMRRGLRRRCFRKMGTFMGEYHENFLYTQLGWEDVLAENGLKIEKEGKVAFEPAEEAECDNEIHFYITARKV